MLLLYPSVSQAVSRQSCFLLTVQANRLFQASRTFFGPIRLTECINFFRELPSYPSGSHTISGGHASFLTIGSQTVSGQSCMLFSYQAHRLFQVSHACFLAIMLTDCFRSVMLSV
jgi:hypothetical protein